jgi:hypothetical protein
MPAEHRAADHKGVIVDQVVEVLHRPCLGLHSVVSELVGDVLGNFPGRAILAGVGDEHLHHLHLLVVVSSLRAAATAQQGPPSPHLGPFGLNCHRSAASQRQGVRL